MTEQNPYRELPVPTQRPAEPTFLAAWKRYRRLCALTSPGFLFAGFLLAPLIHQALGGGHFAGVITMIYVVAWFGVFTAARRQVNAFRCPRCGHRFQSLDKTEIDWCAHCHLRRYALFDPDAENALR
jgi:hypothetical protein